MEGYLVERYWPGVTLDDVSRLNGRLEDSGTEAATFVSSFLVVADELVLVEFLATGADAVLSVSERAGLRCDRIVAATHLLRTTRAEPGPELGP